MKVRASPEVRELIEDHQIWLYMKNSVYSILVIPIPALSKILKFVNAIIWLLLRLQ